MKTAVNYKAVNKPELREQSVREDVWVPSFPVDG